MCIANNLTVWNEEACIVWWVPKMKFSMRTREHSQSSILGLHYNRISGGVIVWIEFVILLRYG